MRPTRTPDCRIQGFTLVELSIVLLIIGLLVGGILVGRELILAAGIRKEVSQIQKYNAAVFSFRNKFNAIPGDMPSDIATAFGFAARLGAPVTDCSNDGIVEGMIAYGSSVIDCNVNIFYFNVVSAVGYDESMLFWNDLAVAGLVPLSSSPYSAAILAFSLPITSTMPQTYAAPGYVFPTFFFDSSGVSARNAYDLCYTSAKNYETFYGNQYKCKPYISSSTAFVLDQKMDDGLPTSGFVQGIDDGSNDCITTDTIPQYVRSKDNTPYCYLQIEMQSL